ncbi:MAG: hypothetical protein RIT45_1282 [Pseudomonadota bacterium]|jgi:tetratricopeptide (TPR) repeat protein
MTDASHPLEQALRAGQAVVWIGPPPPSPPHALCLRVDAGHAGPIGPLGRLRDQALAAFGGDRALIELAAVHLRENLRRRLLAGPPATDALRDLVPLLNRLHETTPGGVVVWLDHVDAAAATTLDALRRLLDARDWLQAPVVLAFDAEPDGEAGRALVASVERRFGAGACIRAGVEPAEVVAAGGPADTPVEDQAPVEPRLDAESLRVLRAAAVVGAHFEPELVAALLEHDEIAVLEALQRAVDAGVPLVPGEDDAMTMPASLRATLLEGLLAPLRRAWDRRLAALLEAAVVPTPTLVPVGEPEVEPVEDVRPLEGPGPEAAAAPVDVAVGDDAAADAGPGAATEPVDGSVAVPVAVPVDGPAAVVPAAAVESADGPVDVPVRVASSARPPTGRDVEQAHRAAIHMLRAGRPDLAAERFLVAAELAGQIGAVGAAVELAEQAQAVLRRVPATGKMRTLHLHVAVARARQLWRAAGAVAGVDLEAALQLVERVLAALDERDPLPLRAEVTALLGGICFDIGDRAHLDRALDALADASRLYEQGGEPLAAASLLNDQAAVWVRLGDPVRANWLLERSREVFASRATDDAGARHELAETELGIARLPLHVAARPGQAQAAAERALALCRSARAHFVALGDARSAARADVVAGRLLLRAGRPDEALQTLAAADQSAARLGDLLGVGDAASASAEALLRAARPEEALDALERAVQAHVGAGSQRGLEHDRELLAAFSHDASLPEAAAARAAALRRSL